MVAHTRLISFLTLLCLLSPFPFLLPIGCFLGLRGTSLPLGGGSAIAVLVPGMVFLVLQELSLCLKPSATLPTPVGLCSVVTVLVSLGAGRVLG